MNPHPTFFVIFNEQGHVVHSSHDPDNLPIMRRYVQKSQEAGDDWQLVEYKFSRVVKCDDVAEVKAI